MVCDERRLRRIGCHGGGWTAKKAVKRHRGAKRILFALHYSDGMLVHDGLQRMGGPPALWGWPRVRVVLIASTLAGCLLWLTSILTVYMVVGRTMVVGCGALLAFGLFERWPIRLPQWLARWVLQVLAIVLVVPLAAYLAYWLTTGGHPHFATDAARLQGYASLTFV